MYRVGLEAILGFTKRGDTLTLDPCVPADWGEFSIEYRHGGSTYEIRVEQPGLARRGEQRVILDGRELDGETIALVDDGSSHRVLIQPRHAGDARP